MIQAGLAGIVKDPTPHPPILSPSLSLFHPRGFSSPKPALALDPEHRGQLSGLIVTDAAIRNITDLLTALQPHCKIIPQGSIRRLAFKAGIG